MNKRIVVIGGGTFSYVRAHLALSAPAFGETARVIAAECKARFDKLETDLVLTKMADSTSNLVTTTDVEYYVRELVQDNTVKVVFFNAAICDFDGQIDSVAPGKYAERLKTSVEKGYAMRLTPSQKIIKLIREKRKDIFLIAFKTTSGATQEQQYEAGLNLLKTASCNLVLANDLVTRNNMIITPEEGVYWNARDRNGALKELVDMAWHRTHLSFTRSTVVAGEAVAWGSEQVYPALRQVVNHCISAGAYKKFNGVTTGHFACKIGNGEFLTSIRKTNFNDIARLGLVRVKTDGDDSVISFGMKPSVGGQSQRIIFADKPDTDCIVHFHCPLKEGSDVPVVSQREYECGSHECGENTVRGLKKFGNLYAVMLDKHGPNIVFSHNIDPQEVIDFIDKNFDTSKSTSGFERVYLGLDLTNPYFTVSFGNQI